MGLITYSTGVALEFDLNDNPDLESIRHALSEVEYTGGFTATALALFLARQVLDPEQSYGARPFQEGIPRLEPDL